VGTVSGSITNDIKFFVAGEWESEGDTRKRFSEGFSFMEKIDDNPSSPNVKAGTPDTVDLVYPSGFTPNNFLDRYSMNATMSFDLNPVRLRLSSLMSYTEYATDYYPMINMLNERDVTDNTLTGLFSGKATWLIDDKTYLDATVSYFYQARDEEDSYFGNDWQKWADSSAVAKHTNGEVAYYDRWLSPLDLRLSGINFTNNGVREATYDKSKQTYFSASVDFVSQLGKHHELKAGFGGRMYDIRQFSVNPYIMAYFDNDYRDPNNDPKTGQYYADWEALKADKTKAYRNRYGNTYGYDVEGNEIDDDGFDGPRSPVMAHAYINDKIEYQDLIVNLGIRLDYFDADDYSLKVLNDANVDEESSDILPESWEEVDPHVHLSPRLGISFPVSEMTKFYAQYGKYVQMPEFNDFYYNNYQYRRQISVAGFYFTSPIGFGFSPIFTTAYEVGFNKQMGEYAALDITGFYKNVEGQIMADRVTKVPGGSLRTYNRLTNGDFATNKGFELKLTLRRYNRVQGQVNYTYTDAEGTGSGETAYISAVDRGSELPTALNPLDFSQTHRGSVMLDYRYGENDGGPVLENMGLNLLYSFNSGHPFTLVQNVGGQADAYTDGVDYMNDTRSRVALEPINASTTPWVTNLDLRVDKTFSIANMLDATIYVRVTNLFDTKNVLNVYQTTGSDTDDGFITNEIAVENYYNAWGEDYLDLYHALNTVNGSSYLSSLGLELWGNPRQIIFGVKLSY
jgi:hypothetical protein